MDKRTAAAERLRNTIIVVSKREFVNGAVVTGGAVVTEGAIAPTMDRPVAVVHEFLNMEKII